jgi:hypothetical protein
MQTIQIENNLYNDIIKYGIDIQTELKNSIENFLENKKNHDYLSSKEFEKDRAYFQDALEGIESGKTELLDQETYNKEMDSFVEDLKVKYGNN